MAHLPMLPVLLLLALALLCLTALVLVACLRRKGAVRGFLRAGSVQLGIEIDPNPFDGTAPGPEAMSPVGLPPLPPPSAHARVPR